MHSTIKNFTKNVQFQIKSAFLLIVHNLIVVGCQIFVQMRAWCKI